MNQPLGEKMEQTILTRILEITIYSSVIFLFVWLFRAAFSKWLSPALKYALWFLVVLRLCIPVTLESAVHLFTLPQAATETAQVAATTPAPQTQQPRENSPLLDGGVATARPQGELAQAVVPQPTAIAALSWQQWLMIVWGAGFLVALGLSLALMIQLNSRIRRLGCEPGRKTQALYDSLKAQMKIRGRVPLSLMPDISSPALTVEPRPRLLLPDRLLYEASAESMGFAMAHELMLYKRGYHLVCMLLLLLRAVYWFHPVSWLLLHMMRLDMETACDAMVVSRLDRAQKLNYVNLLLSLGEESSQAALHLKGEN